MKDTKELIEIVRTLLEVETVESLPLPDLLGLIIYYHTISNHNDPNYNNNLTTCKNKIDHFLTTALSQEDALLDSNNLRSLIMIASLQEQYVTEDTVAEKLHKLDVLLFELSLILTNNFLVENLYKVLQICNYLRERSLNSTAKTLLDQILENLFSTPLAESSSFWNQIIKNHRDTCQHIQFGLHEGICGMLMMLIQLSDYNLYTDKIKKIIKEGTLFLLSYKTEADFSSGKYSIFPESVSMREHNPIFSNKLSWSGSDLNEAILLYNLNTIFHDPELLNKANLVGLNTLLRTDEKATAVHSAKIFDGAAGIALTYYSLYLLSGHSSYKSGYQYWINQTAIFLETELKDGLYKNKSSFTHGLTGIFYSLVAMEKKIDTFWNKALLLNHSTVEEITKLNS